MAALQLILGCGHRGRRMLELICGPRCLACRHERCSTCAFAGCMALVLPCAQFSSLDPVAQP